MGRGLLLPTVLLLAACASGLKTTSDWDPAADFTALQTDAWKPDAEGGAGVDQLTDNRIRVAIEADLNGKGLREAAMAQADIVVAYQITTQEQTDYMNELEVMCKDCDRIILKKEIAQKLFREGGFMIKYFKRRGFRVTDAGDNYIMLWDQNLLRDPRLDDKVH